MAKFQERTKALLMRRKGQSLKEISNVLGVSKSTVSSWCRDIKLTEKQITKLAMKQTEGSYKGRMIAAENKRLARIKEEQQLKQEGLKEIGKINFRDFFIAGVAIYWSEGYTYSGGSEVGFTNSDPKMVLFMLEWFKKVCKISNDRFSLSIRVNEARKNRVGKIESYWAKITKIPLAQFNKTVLIKSQAKKIFVNSDDYYGTLRIVVRRGSQLRRRINGWLDGLVRVVN